MRCAVIVSLAALLLGVQAALLVSPAHGIDLNCLIEPHVVVTLSTPVEGLLEQVTVDRGDLVKAGQVLAMLESNLERASGAVTRAQAELQNKRLAELEQQRATAALELRTIRSPVAGVVMERLLSPGELVKLNPILKIAQIDPLRVEVFAPVALLGKVAVGMKAQVMPEAPVGGVYSARVKVVDRVVDAASGTFGVRLELPNPDYRLPAGLKCKVRFLP
jgi:multidrug efflux pump subunit AcrA (membrane-fusion protein)